MTTEIEIAKLALNVGAFGLNILIIILLYRLTNKWAGTALSTLQKTTKALEKLSTKIDTLTRKSSK